MADVSRSAYRALVWDDERFVQFFREFTPVDELSLLEIASRPARRPNDADYLASLRAIPWVFSWTQNRVLLPAWFGCGTAFAAVGDANLRDLYERLPFFRAVVDNLEMTLAKSSLSIARGYLSLVSDTSLFAIIEEEKRAHGRGRARRNRRRTPARAPADAAALGRAAQPVRRPDERGAGRAAAPPPRGRRNRAAPAPALDRGHRRRAPQHGLTPEAQPGSDCEPGSLFEPGS